MPGWLSKALEKLRRGSREPPTPPVTTQSSPGQIADLQETYGADMSPPPGEPKTDGDR
jgi:hypothetical protein